jgi:hypothetical protein
VRCLLVVALAVGAVSAVPLLPPGASPAGAEATTGTAGMFVPTQGSVLDTRTGLGGVSGPVAANSWYPVQVAGQAGVPTTGVSSVQVSVSVLSPVSTGLVKVAANGTALVPIAALTYTGGGGSISASSITALPADGKIRVLAQTSVTLLVHVQGYYTAGNGSPAPGGYVPVNPTRMVDTRIGTGLPQAKLATGSTTAVSVGGLHSVPADASAVFLMLTAISTSATAGHLSPYPTGTTRPPNVSLNYLANTATILGAAVDLGTGGQFNLWIGPAGTAIEVVVDVIGYYTATLGTDGAFTPGVARVYDSRTSPNIALPARTSRVVQVGGVAGLPRPTDDVGAYALSAQVVHAGSSAGSLAVGPGDQPWAVVAAVYFSAGSNVRSSLVIVPAAGDGSVLLVNSSVDPINVILDAEGWFAYSPGPKPNAADALEADHGPILTQTEPEPAAPSSVSAVASGVFTNPAGQPVANIPVTISVPETSVTADGSEAERTVLATVTTDAEGAWSYTPPPTLPTDVQAVADANNGVLNLDAVAIGAAPDGTLLNATAGASVAVPTSGEVPPAAPAAAAGTSPAQAVAMHVVPAANTSATAPSDAEAAQSDASVAEAQAVAYHPPTWQTNNAPSDPTYTPDVVDGVDYRTTAVAAWSSSIVPPCYIYDSVNKTTIAYTVVGEAHAYWDTKASFRFNATLSNNFKVETSVDGVHWNASSSVRLESQVGRSTGFSNQGPYFGRQYQVPIKYRWIKTTYRCFRAWGGSYYTTSYAIRPVGYSIPAGGYVGKMGNNVADNDGFGGWYRSNPAYRGRLQPGAFFAITRGKSITYGNAATVWGVGIAVETIYNSNHEQRIDAGSSHAASHDIWGAKGSLSGDPGTIYSW